MASLYGHASLITRVVPALSFDAANPINYGCIACLPFADGSGPGNRDIGPRKLQVTSASSSWSTGPIASTGAIKFNGTSEAMSLAIDLSPYATVSLAFWMYWDTFANDDDLAFEYTANYNVNAGFIVDPNSSSPVNFVFGATINYGHFTRPSGAAWHHYVLNMPHGTANTAYIDGAAVTVTMDLTTGVGNYANSALNFMCRNGNNLFGAGRLWMVRIYGGRELNAGEALELYSEPLAGLVSPWDRMLSRAMQAPQAASGGVFTPYFFREHVARVA